MLIIAITGGIGAGKSATVDMFKQHGVPIIDTDIIARELVDSDPAILEAITTEFGNEVLNNNNELDRAKLREIIFNDDSKRDALQNILHPRIHQQVLQDIQSLNSEYCIIVIPLLVESKHAYPYDRVLLIDANESTQLQRASKRDNNNKKLIQKIMAAQASRDQRHAVADDIIDNNGSLAELQEQVDSLHSKYLSQARAQLPS